MTASGAHLFSFANLGRIYPIGPVTRVRFTEYGGSGGLVSISVARAMGVTPAVHSLIVLSWWPVSS